MNHSLAIFIKRFLSHYLPVQKGLSVNTITTYRDAIKLLLCYASDKIPKQIDELMVEDITETLVLDFLEHLEQVRNCCPNTRNIRLAAIRCLFLFIARQEPILIVQSQQIRAIPKKRTKHKQVGYLEEKEVQAVLEALDINSRTGIRNKALLLLLYNTGTRVSEIVELKLDDLHLEEAPQVRLFGKGRKERSCPLWPETIDAIKAYLKQRDPVVSGIKNVFLNATGTAITRFGIRYITRQLGSKTPLLASSGKQLNPHTVRHTTAMHLLRAGNDVNMVSYWLGHADINTTHIYLEIDMEMKRKMIEKAGAPTVSDKTPWQEPKILQWLERLSKRPELCADFH